MKCEKDDAREDGEAREKVNCEGIERETRKAFTTTKREREERQNVIKGQRRKPVKESLTLGKGIWAVY